MAGLCSDYDCSMEHSGAREPSQQQRKSTEFAGTLFDVEVITWSDEQGRSIRREVVRHPGAVLIVPELDDGQLVLIRNRRIAVGDALWEFPAGTLDKDEPIEASARRELEEETGYRCASLVSLGRFYTSPGMSDELMHVYHARGLTEHAQNLEPHEEIDVDVIEAAQLFAMIDRGELVDGKTIAAAMLWQRQTQGK